jgi:membrane-associated protease RseP (regulator of RpoE activity)
MALLKFAAIVAFIVFIHELGHLLASWMVGIRVTVFSIGFGPSLIHGHRFKSDDGNVYRFSTIFSSGAYHILSFRPLTLRRVSRDDNQKSISEGVDPHVGTDFRISIIPLGGYISLFGTEEESRDKKCAYVNSSLWQKILINLAGPMFNICTAILFLTTSFMLNQDLEIPRPCAENPQEECVLDLHDPVTAFKTSVAVSVVGPIYVMIKIPEISKGIAKSFGDHVGKKPMGIFSGANTISTMGEESWDMFFLKLWMISLALGLGNLLPIPPLDGAQCWKAFIELLPDGMVRSGLSKTWIALAIIMMTLELSLFALTTIHDIWLWLAH